MLSAIIVAFIVALLFRRNFQRLDARPTQTKLSEILRICLPASASRIEPTRGGHKPMQIVADRAGDDFQCDQSDSRIKKMMALRQLRLINLGALHLRPPCPLRGGNLLFNRHAHRPLLPRPSSVGHRTVEKSAKLFVQTIELFFDRRSSS